MQTEKVILVSIDGMRPDGFEACGHSFCEEMKKIGSYTLTGRTVFPSVTLPCHMSLFHSVDPERHGVTTNTYVPPVRPVEGLFELSERSGRKNAMFYGWEPLRDVSRPGSLTWAEFVEAYSDEHTDVLLADRAIERIEKSEPDLVFLYMVETDDKGGHDCGWMTPTYLSYIHCAVDCVKRIYKRFGDRYTVIVTADHGGHGRGHGSDCEEDMTIPLFFIGKRFEAGKELSGVSILDVAPTVADLMDLPAPREWEGKSQLRQKE